MPFFKGIAYYDDRLYVLYLCKGTVGVDSNGAVISNIYHDEPTADSHWCLVTYGNHINYPIHSVKHFETKDEALDYIKRMEPEVPLISLGGASPKQPLSYDEFVRWKKENKFKEFDYKSVYTPGGSNNRESIFQTKEQFLKSNPNWPRI